MPKYLINLILLGLGAVAVAAVLCGCGGGDSSSTSTSASNGSTGTTSQTETTPSNKRQNPSRAESSKKSGASQEAGASQEGSGGTSQQKTQSPRGSQPSSPSSKANAPSAAPKSSTISKATFVKEANTICARGKRKSLAETGKYVEKHETKAPGSNTAQLGKALQIVVIPQIRQQMKEIDALGAPAGDEARVEAFLSSMQKALTAASKSSVTSGSGFSRFFEEAGALAFEVGIATCSYS